MNKKIPVILDVDTGIDDAVSIMIALKSKKLDVRLINTCAGNTTLNNVVDNTLDVLCALRESKVPVAKGADKSLSGENPHISAHGADGLGGWDIKSGLKPLNINSVEATHEVLKNAKEPITYICLAPLTNIANFIKAYPEDLKNIKEFVLMIASNEQLKSGEMPYREFNVAADWVACDIVLKSNVKKVVVSMEMGHTAYLDWQDVFKTKQTNNFGQTLEKMYRKYNDFHVKNGIATHDGCAVAYAINPKLFECKPARLQVKQFSEDGLGRVVVDYSGEANAMITTKINVKKFKRLYFDCLKRVR